MPSRPACESPEIAAAERVVRRAASRLVRAWVGCVGATLLFIAAVTAVSVLAMLSAGWRLFAGLSVFLLFAVALLVRLTPREPGLSEGVELPDGEMVPFCDWVARRCDGWRPRVRFSWAPALWVDGTTLVVGLPLLLCLREEELAVLLRDARATALTEDRRPVAFAVRLSRGSVGRRILDLGEASWTSRVITDALEARMHVLDKALGDLVRARRVWAGMPWLLVEKRVHVIEEAWDHLVDTKLAPALAQGVWHDEPFTGLKRFLEACELAGWIDGEDRLAGTDAVGTLPPVGGVEHLVAAQLVAGSTDSEEPVSWEDHPAAVTVPCWRLTVADGVHAAAQLTGSPVPATVSALLKLDADGWSPGWAAAMSPHRQAADTSVDGSPVHEVLTAAASLALVEAGAATFSWEWPVGTVLLDQEGRNLHVWHRVAEERGLTEQWLRGLGADPGAPIWLAEGVAPVAEHAIRAFNATVDGTRRRVVLSNKAIYIFPEPASLRTGLSWSRKSGQAEDPYMTAVDDQQVPPDAVAIPYDDIGHSDLVPKPGSTDGRVRSMA